MPDPIFEIGPRQNLLAPLAGSHNVKGPGPSLEVPDPNFEVPDPKSEVPDSGSGRSGVTLIPGHAAHKFGDPGHHKYCGYMLIDCRRC